MPIQRSRQTWTPGSQVKIGFLSLKVLNVIPTPGDHRPDKYILTDGKGNVYEFTPYLGLEKVHSAPIPPQEPTVARPLYVSTLPPLR